jgi:hypothetical protein
MRNVQCDGEFQLKVGYADREQAPLEISKLRLGPEALFRIAKLPIPENDNNTYRPKIEAVDWNTSTNSRVEIPGDFRARGGFTATRWSGVRIHGFEKAYVSRQSPNVMPSEEAEDL